MSIEIVKEKENLLLNRKRYTLNYVSQENKTPSRKQLLKEASQKLGAKEDLMIVKHLYPQFGKTNTKILLDVYKDRVMLEKCENQKLIAKHQDKVEEMSKA